MGTTRRTAPGRVWVAVALAGLPSVVHSGLLTSWPQDQRDDEPDVTITMGSFAVRSPSVTEQWYELAMDSGLPLLALSVTLALPAHRRSRALPWVAGLLVLTGAGMGWIASREGLLYIPGSAVAAVSYLLSGLLVAREIVSGDSLRAGDPPAGAPGPAAP